MAEKNIDRMLDIAENKYRLSVVVAKRALQLSAGAPSVMDEEERQRTRNVVTQAMREIATGQLTVGHQLIDEARFFRDAKDRRARQQRLEMEANRDNSDD